MSLSEICIRRPILATVLSLVIVLFGVLGFQQLGIREYPAVDPPVVSVSTSYAGAAPDIIDSQITEPLEQAVSSVAGIRSLTSTSREGSSGIRIEFDLDTDLEAAANDVRDKVSQALGRLPADADSPIVDKADADSEPIIFMALQSEVVSSLELSHLAETTIKERMQTIPGVSDVRIFGERRYAMRLWLDPERMAAHRVVPSDVFNALNQQNVDLPSGRVEGSSVDLSVRTDGRLFHPEDFEALVVRREGNRPITLRDIGAAELSAEDMRRANYSQGNPMVGVAIIPQPNTNAMAIADEFFRRLLPIQEELGDRYSIVIGYDFTRFVRQSIHEVNETLLAAFLLVAFIIFVFLRDWRAVLIPVIAIPISIVSGFFILYIAGYSINILTLLALVLAIGLVCDDAIVVLENIATKVEAGLGPMEAAIEGSREIYFAVLSTTVSLVAVFMPVLFMEGLTGRLFREFGVVIAGTVMVSAFVALTLTPMMCRLFLRRGGDHGFLYRVTEPIFVGMTWLYRTTLYPFVRFPFLVAPVLVLAVFSIMYCYERIPQELAPYEDRSNIRVTMRSPEGTSYAYAAQEARQVAELLEEKYADSIHRIFAITGRPTPNQAVLNIYLKDPSERTKSAQDLLKEMTPDLNSSRLLRPSPAIPPTIGDRRAGQPVQFVLRAPNLERMREVLPAFLAEASQNPALTAVDADLKLNQPQLKLRIDRDRAAELAVDVRDIARAIQLTFGESRLAFFTMNGRQYQVIGRLEGERRDEPTDLARVTVRNQRGDIIPLNSVVTYEETIAPAAIFRYDRFISATVSAGLAPGFTLGQGIEAMRDTARLTLPSDFSTALAGQSKDFEESSSSLLFAFLAALMLIYLILAAQFESWVDPFVILLAVPLSLSGALLSLYLTEQTLNVFSQIGIIMLVGLVTKNGILIVEFANQRRDAGLSARDAVLDAAAARLRPILMTSLSTILGILPLALSLGAAAGSRQSLGIAVVGGLTLASFLTLYVVPAIYAFLAAPRSVSQEEPKPVIAKSQPPHPAS